MAAGGMTPAASIVICTFNRPILFERTLRSCLADATRRGLPHEVVVADNGPARHAQAIIEAVLGAGPAVPVRCVPCGPPNISVARNAGLAAARAPLVAFLDDDLEVEPGWLDALVAALDDPRFDAALGPVRPAFEGGAPPGWDPEAAAFTRDPGLPTGTEIAASGPLRPPGFVVSTASSIWRRATCFTDPAPFDPAFGASGGEDLDLFLRLQRRGRRFAWCAGAGVVEAVPRHRTALDFQRQRAFTFAQAYAAALLNNTDHRALQTLRLRLVGAAQALAWGAAEPLLRAAAPLLPNARMAAERAALRSAAARGKLRWRRRAGIYQAEPPG
jgi:succinoglycan biosynthesis protein ExoM